MKSPLISIETYHSQLKITFISSCLQINLKISASHILTSLQSLSPPPVCLQPLDLSSSQYTPSFQVFLNFGRLPKFWKANQSWCIIANQPFSRISCGYFEMTMTDASPKTRSVLDYVLLVIPWKNIQDGTNGVMDITVKFIIMWHFECFFLDVFCVIKEKEGVQWWYS